MSYSSVGVCDFKRCPAGGQEGAAAAGIGGETAVTSPYLNVLPQEGAEGARPTRPGPQLHPAPMRNRSRLWSAMSFGEMDSLQNALDAFRAEEEIASQPFGLSDGPDGSMRQRRRKPPRGNSSFLLRAADSTGGASLGKIGPKVELMHGDVASGAMHGMLHGCSPLHAHVSWLASDVGDPCFTPPCNQGLHNGSCKCIMLSRPCSKRRTRAVRMCTATCSACGWVAL